jgi:uncharacterized membrane protein YebE (DUF533 family)
MSDHEKTKENIATAAVSGAGATVGGAGGATIGVLELLAARGSVTELSAAVVIGAGAVAGAGLAYGVFRLFRNRRKAPERNKPVASQKAPQ